MFVLPVSGWMVELAQLTGAEDLLLQEIPATDLRIAVSLIGKLARRCQSDTGATDWSALTVTDLGAAMLLVRRSAIGDRLCAEAACTNSMCSAAVDVSFKIGEYLASKQPRKVRGVEPTQREGWYTLKGETTRFRLPTCADLLEIEAAAPVSTLDQLKERCFDPAVPAASLRRRMEGAMSAMAPPLSGELCGRCPECGLSFTTYFDTVPYVIEELRAAATGVYGEIHLLALNYKWPEQTILALPRRRRMQYAGMLRADGGSA